MSSKSLLESVAATLKQARADRAKLDHLIAGLELAAEAPGAAAKPKSRAAKPKSRAAKPKPAERRAPRVRVAGPARAELKKAILAAMAHHDGKTISTSQIAKFVDRHRPATLRRKAISHVSWVNRCRLMLDQMAQADEVAKARIAGNGIDSYWTAI